MLVVHLRFALSAIDGRSNCVSMENAWKVASYVHINGSIGLQSCTIVLRSLRFVGDHVYFLHTFFCVGVDASYFSSKVIHTLTRKATRH